MFRVRDTYEPLFTWLPKTWLLRTGWEMHGPIPATAIPGRVK